jgi:hypothetical protein
MPTRYSKHRASWGGNVNSFDVPLALQVAHYWKFHQELPTRLAVELAMALEQKGHWPQYLREWLDQVKRTTKPEERAPTVKYLLEKMP